MRWFYKKKFEQYAGVTIRGFSHPYKERHDIEPVGTIIGYSKKQLVVSCKTVDGWPKENWKEFIFIDPLEELANEYGYWFVTLKEVKDSIRIELMKEMKLSADEH
jgi:hypothetical protein